MGGVIVAMLTPCLFSCSDDDDNGPVMTPPQYESVSGKYEITASGSPYESIELGASGDYIVTSKGYSSYTATAKQSFIFYKSISETRATTRGNLTYGTYTQVSDDTFDLEGFGTIQLKKDANQQVTSITISVDGETTEYTTKKSETMGDDNKTNALCRTWKVVQTHEMGYDEYEGGDYDITFTPADDPESLSEVMFTKSGTFLQFYSDGDFEVNDWSWKDKGKGVVQLSNFVDGEGTITVTFSDDKLYVHESYRDGSEWGEITVELTEKK